MTNPKMIKNLHTMTISRVLILINALLITACSVNEFGYVDVEQYRGDGAVVYRATATGIHLGTRFDDISLTLGRREAIFIFPEACDVGGESAAVALAATSEVRWPEASIIYTEGLLLLGGSKQFEITLGVREASLIVSRKDSGSFHRRLRFYHNDLAATQLFFEGEQDCVGVVNVD